MSVATAPALMDGFGRRITYLRVSVTDRCDLRCRYCMTERMTFAPRPDLLDFAELDRLCDVFIRRGVRRLRLTGGEPLTRRGLVDFMRDLDRHTRSGALDEVTLTTNGTRLSAFADDLAAAGLRRINISLDTLNRETFARITRRDRLGDVLEGIAAAKAAKLKIKINTVVLKRDNAHDLPDLIRWAHQGGMDISLIETMPLGDVDEDRTDQFVSLTSVREALSKLWTLETIPDETGGPSRYVRVRETGGRLGMITPLSQTFCTTCNRVRLTCTGRLYLCLGREENVDFRAALRAGASDADLSELLDVALKAKPAAHDFIMRHAAMPAVARHMSVTGG